ncbi:hypothetical protein QW131_34520 [Roseibium salinum]|nr:hypothetical protein [Roseibium salinum]
MKQGDRRNQNAGDGTERCSHTPAEIVKAFDIDADQARAPFRLIDGLYHLADIGKVQNGKEHHEQHSDDGDDEQGISGNHDGADEYRLDVEDARHGKHFASPNRSGYPAEHEAEGNAHQRKPDVRSTPDWPDQPTTEGDTNKEHHRNGDKAGRKKRDADCHNQHIGEKRTCHDEIAVTKADDGRGTIDDGK